MTDEVRNPDLPDQQTDTSGAPEAPDVARGQEPTQSEAGGTSPGGVDGYAEGTGGSAVEQDLNNLVEEARSKADEYLDLAQRTKADFDNYRKRMVAENQSALQRGRFEVIDGVIGAIDNLERVLDAAGIGRSEALEGEIPGSVPITEQGVIVVWRDLHSMLSKSGVEGYSPAGEQFDPAWHEALQAIPSEDVESGTVVEVLQRGYRSGETVLRPARVVVAQ